METQQQPLDTSTDKKTKYKANYKHLMNADFMLMPARLVFISVDA